MNSATIPFFSTTALLMPSISAVLITLNAEKHLHSCLSSLKGLVDEIVIVDNGSTDNTLTIAKSFTDKIHITDDWPGFGIQKQRALDMASNEWVLSIDSDEVITATLEKEIKDTLKEPEHDAYQIPRLNYFIKKPVRFGGCQKDAPVRLFRKSKARFSKDLVHEKVEVSGQIGLLKHKMNHFTVDKIEDALAKMDNYSTLNAKLAFSKGKKSNVLKAYFRGLWTFIKLYIFQLGFLDKGAGFSYCMLKGEGCYYKYLKLSHLTEG